MAEEEIEYDGAGMQAAVYDEDNIVHLEWNEHIRRRPGMYIGKLGDGSSAVSYTHLTLPTICSV